MMSNVAVKFAASSLVLGLTMVSCKPAGEMSRPAALSSHAVKADQQAAKRYAEAEDALRQRDFAKALTLTEQAVELAPRDVGYRMLLADLYVRNGRFQSAETTFNDVLTLNPGNIRAGLNLALAQIANGKPFAAVARLDRMADSVPASDLGLAYALAGRTDRSVAILETAARAPEADARTRQNLALAYALAGNWGKARATAAQDISPAELDARMEQWAAMARPQGGPTQVASVLGVTPVADSGQPVQLALAPTPADVRVAEAPAAEAAGEDRAEIALADPAPGVAGAVEDSQPLYAEAVRTLFKPAAPVILASAPIADAPIPSYAPARKTPRIAGRTEQTVKGVQGSFVVQLGAYSTPSGVEKAWAEANKRYPLAAERMPVSTTVSIPGKGTFHRLSVSGFETQGEATHLCGVIRAKGGACFVRAVAGDTPVRWASRSSRRA
jgi:Flp pilus assembly protein TadD